jgi:hypothetical protein
MRRYTQEELIANIKPHVITASVYLAGASSVYPAATAF